jgi:transposase
VAGSPQPVAGKDNRATAVKKSSPVRPRRDFKALEERRMRAADLFRRGRRPAEVSRELGVSIQSASEWYQRWSAGGKKALRGAGRAGRLPRLDAGQLARVERALAQGPKANGFGTELWTLPRVAEVIERVTGVGYHPGHVWRILREQLGWTRQRPARRAVERDDAAIERWAKERWPTVKKAPGAGAR